MDVGYSLDETAMMSHPNAERAKLAQDAQLALEAYQRAKSEPGTPISELAALWADYITKVEKVRKPNG